MFGRSMCSVGDLDGDGITDVWVGDPGDRRQGSRRGSGRVFSLRSQAQLDLVWSPRFGIGYGVTAAGLGDLDGDGKDEFAVAMPGLGSGGTVHLRTMANTTRVGRSCGPGAFRLDAGAAHIGSRGFDWFVSGRRRDTVGALWVGLRPSLPTPVGDCVLWLDPAQVALAATSRTDAAGRAAQRQPLPTIGSLVGVELAAQALLANPRAPLVMESSNGIYARIQR